MSLLEPRIVLRQVQLFKENENLGGLEIWTMKVSANSSLLLGSSESNRWAHVKHSLVRYNPMGLKLIVISESVRTARISGLEKQGRRYNERLAA